MTHPPDKIFTINDARKLRDEVGEQIAVLVEAFERRVTGAEVISISIGQVKTKDRRGIRVERTKCTIGVRLREGSGAGSDL